MTTEAIERAPVAKMAAPQSWVKSWLFFIALLVFCMVLVGGATRITNSGLSITEWLPLAGALPPMNDADWLALFEKYKQIPQFKIQNPGMTLDDFKPIFWWEWSHRLLGRVIGAALLLVLVGYGLLRKLSWPLAIKIFILGLLVGAQGALGWYMVQSGLAERTDVSQYRLAAHLVLASICFVAIIWVAFGIGNQRRIPGGFGGFCAWVLLLLLLLQVAAGGFVAGLDAGHASNTWPRMEGVWVPDGIWALKPAWLNAFENALAVQFNHRALAYFIFAFALLHAWFAFRLSALILAYVLFIQVAIGILAVVFNVKAGIALTHQATAMIALAVAIWNCHSFALVRKGLVPGQQ